MLSERNWGETSFRSVTRTVFGRLLQPTLDREGVVGHPSSVMDIQFYPTFDREGVVAHPSTVMDINFYPNFNSWVAEKNDSPLRYTSHKSQLVSLKTAQL